MPEKQRFSRCILLMLSRQRSSFNQVSRQHLPCSSAACLSLFASSCANQFAPNFLSVSLEVSIESRMPLFRCLDCLQILWRRNFLNQQSQIFKNMKDTGLISFVEVPVRLNRVFRNKKLSGIFQLPASFWRKEEEVYFPCSFHLFSLFCRPLKYSCHSTSYVVVLSVRLWGWYLLSN